MVILAGLDNSRRHGIAHVLSGALHIWFQKEKSMAIIVLPIDLNEQTDATSWNCMQQVARTNMCQPSPDPSWMKITVISLSLSLSVHTS